MPSGVWKEWLRNVTLDAPQQTNRASAATKERIAGVSRNTGEYGVRYLHDPRITRSSAE